MATNINIIRSETEEERELEILRNVWYTENSEWRKHLFFRPHQSFTDEEWCQVKGLRLWRTKEDFEDYLQKRVREQRGELFGQVRARIRINWDVAHKQSQMEPYLSLDAIKEKYKFTTQTTKSKNSNRRGISTKYTEEIMFDIPQGTEELYVRLRNKKKLFFDDLITSKKVKLENLFRNGYDEITWEFFDKDGRRGVATLELQKISADMPEGSTTMQNEDGYASYIGSKSGNAFNCTKH